jgi:hypothetical protein
LFTQVVGDPTLDDTLAAGVMLMRGISWFLPIPVGYLVLVVFRWEHRHRPVAVGDDVPDELGSAAPAA